MSQQATQITRHNRSNMIHTQPTTQPCSGVTYVHWWSGACAAARKHGCMGCGSSRAAAGMARRASSQSPQRRPRRIGVHGLQDGGTLLERFHDAFRVIAGTTALGPLRGSRGGTTASAVPTRRRVQSTTAAAGPASGGSTRCQRRGQLGHRVRRATTSHGQSTGHTRRGEHR